MEATNTPKVTVVMATHHGDRLDHLQQSVNSILDQSVEDFEYIIVVDGPVSDDKLQYLNSIDDNRVRVIWLEKNSGPARARNTGIAEAKGEYLAIQDADDISDPRRLEKQYAYLIENNLDLMSCCLKLIDNDGVVIRKKPYPTSEKTIIRLMPFLNSINNSAVFCKTSLLRAFPYDETLRFGEDYRTWISLVRHGLRLGNHWDYLVSYRLTFSRRRGWPIAMADLSNKFAALRIARWYVWPGVLLAASATVVFRMIPGWAMLHGYRLKEWLLPKVARYQ